MNGVHDMGGMHGFGPVLPAREGREEDEPVFHEPWEGRAFGLAISMGRHGVFSPEGLRFAIESLEPARYLASSYYERWMAALEGALLKKGIVTEEELKDRTELFQKHPDAPLPRRDAPGEAETVLKGINTRHPAQREGVATPEFKVGDSVRARNINPTGHTRLPRYVRGRKGLVARLHGIHDSDDAVSQGRGPEPQAVYSVRFEARELWGESAGSRDWVYIDMWESYLEPV